MDLEAHREKEKQLAEDHVKMERLLMNKRRKSSALDEKELEQVSAVSTNNNTCTFGDS